MSLIPQKNGMVPHPSKDPPTDSSTTKWNKGSRTVNIANVVGSGERQKRAEEAIIAANAQMRAEGFPFTIPSKLTEKTVSQEELYTLMQYWTDYRIKIELELGITPSQGGSLTKTLKRISDVAFLIYLIHEKKDLLDVVRQCDDDHWERCKEEVRKHYRNKRKRKRDAHVSESMPAPAPVAKSMPAPVTVPKSMPAPAPVSTPASVAKSIPAPVTVSVSVAK